MDINRFWNIYWCKRFLGLSIARGACGGPKRWLVIAPCLDGAARGHVNASLASHGCITFGVGAAEPVVHWIRVAAPCTVQPCWSRATRSYHVPCISIARTWGDVIIITCYLSSQTFELDTAHAMQRQLHYIRVYYIALITCTGYRLPAGWEDTGRQAVTTLHTRAGSKRYWEKRNLKNIIPHFLKITVEP